MVDGREWMYMRRSGGSLNPDFIVGVQKFILFATSQTSFMDGDNIRCPCVACDNTRYEEVQVVQYHLAIWEQWLAYWDRDDVKAKFETAKKCRMSEPEGEGTGQVFHRLGSKSIMQYAHELAVEREVLVKDCMYDAYSRSHIKADGTFTDPKAAKIHGQIEEYIEEERLEGREVTHNEAYLHVVKLDEKKRIFGSGELAKSIASELSTGTSHFHSQAACDDRLSEMQQQLQEEREAREKLAEQTQQLQEALQAQQRLFEQFVSQSRGDADHPPPS